MEILTEERFSKKTCFIAPFCDKDIYNVLRGMAIKIAHFSLDLNDFDK